LDDKKLIFAAINITTMLMLVAINSLAGSIATAATEQSCDNWTDRHIKSHERLEDGKVSKGDIISPDKGVENRDKVCR
jgi:hypothetical protein